MTHYDQLVKQIADWAKYCGEVRAENAYIDGGVQPFEEDPDETPELEDREIDLLRKELAAMANSVTREAWERRMAELVVRLAEMAAIVRELMPNAPPPPEESR